MPGSPLFMRDVTLTLELVTAGTPVQYQCDVSTAEILPEPGDEVTYSTLCASGSYSSIGKTTYALHIVAVQRWAADGLASFLWDHDGELATFEYQAHGDGVTPTADLPGMAGEIRLIAGNYGGAVDEFAELDVTLPCSSKPTKITAAFPLTADAGPSIVDVEEAVQAGEITGEEGTALEAMGDEPAPRKRR
jgi:hypothetical protein